MHYSEIQHKIIDGYITGFNSTDGINPWEPISRRGYLSWENNKNYYIEFNYFQIGYSDQKKGNKISNSYTTIIMHYSDFITTDKEIKNPYFIIRYNEQKIPKIVVINDNVGYKSSFDASIAWDLNKKSKLNNEIEISHILKGI